MNKEDKEYMERIFDIWIAEVSCFKEQLREEKKRFMELP